VSPSRFEDHFSAQAAAYRRFRPGYPSVLFPYLVSIAPGRDRAWDCASGSGQAALGLAPFFAHVVATDVSAPQLAHAPPGANVSYVLTMAEEPAIDSRCADLITVAQALHWLDRERFYAAARRILKPRGVIAAWAYGLIRIAPDLDGIIEHWYREDLGPYWPAQRRRVDDAYRSLEFPFPELETPRFTMTATWSLEKLLGYLGTWSAV
jgi:SAM-dependent methyltransferase